MAERLKKSDSELLHDPGARRVGMVYAKALLGAAEKAGVAEAVVAELDSLVVDVLDHLPKLENILAAGIISPEEKLSLIERAVGAQASPLLMSFLRVVGQHRRLDALRVIRVSAHVLLDEMRGRVPVVVTTAQPLDENLAQALAARLQGMLGGEPRLERRVDPDLIGGLVVRIGDTIYDGSIASQLEQLRGQMINRSVHEIQSRRDRFSTAAGN